MKNIVPLLLCTLLSLAIGSLGGLWGSVKRAESGSNEPNAARRKVAMVDHDAMLRELKPIVTNLSAPPGAWVRLELALAIAGPGAKTLDKQLIEFSSDVTDFLRTVSARQLQGPNGLRRLREDLLERARFRIGKEAEAVLIQTLVIQ
ncbi:MAG TPA: flagellar basal body-associated FliL family protein [Rhodoblastus sp.]|nr:flagellar basal body-associated FliL family protein [Rhodoblastus sp.]